MMMKKRARRSSRQAPVPASDPPVTELRAKAEGGKGPNWSSERFGDLSRFATSDTFEWAPNESTDMLRIDPELVQALARDGISLQWGTGEVRGMPMPDQLATYAKGGWQLVQRGDFSGALDFLTPDMAGGDVIRNGDCVLMARPMAVTEKAREHARRAAAEPLKASQHAISGGIPGVTGGDHPTVRNSINRTFEPLQVPE